MAPKEWSNESTITPGELRHIVAQHAKAIERLSWKTQDVQECLEGHMPLFRALASHTIKLNRVEVRKACANAHLALSPSEIYTFSEKLVSVVKWVKTRLRDRGSGKYLPQCVINIEKIWRQQHRKATEEEKEKKSGGKKEAKEAKEAKVGSASSLDDKPAAGIRAVFGLGAKPATSSGIEVLSSDSDLEEVSAGVASSSGSSKSLHTSPTQSAQTNPQIASK